MAVDDDLKKLIHQLVHRDLGEISLNGSDIKVRVIEPEEDSKLSLRTPVYFGGNYIPKSVRRCLSEKTPFNDHFIKAYLTVDEDNFRIHLNYLGMFDSLDRKKFQDILVDFSHLAGEWRNYLDENDRQDLVHVRVG